LSATKSSAGPRTSASYRSLLAANHARLLFAFSSRRNRKSAGVNDGSAVLPSIAGHCNARLGSDIVIASRVTRAGILRAADSTRLQRLVQGHGMRVGAARFVAGETLDECVVVMRRLNDAGLHANTTLLGEAILDPSGAAAVTAEYERILDRVVAEALKANVALKLTHLGLSFDAEAAFRNVERLVAHAGGLGSFIRIDMEQSAHLDATLQIYERLRAAGHDNVGTALQSYLYRTPDD